MDIVALGTLQPDQRQKLVVLAGMMIVQVGELRKTCWTRELPGFGTRHYVSGRKVYIVQARMEGRTRTVTIGNAKVLSRAQAMDVARRVLLRAHTGENPAEERKRLRKIPSYRDFLKTYWERVSPTWLNQK